MKRAALWIVGLGLVGLLRAHPAHAFSSEGHGGGEGRLARPGEPGRGAAPLAAPEQGGPAGYDFSSSLFNFSMRRADRPPDNPDAPPKDAGAAPPPKNDRGPLGRFWHGVVDWLGF